MATRWTITFQTLSGKTAVVAVGDAGYTGTPVALTPAEHAFSLSRSQGDAITPVMSETGYLRVIDMYGPDGDEHIQDMHPAGAFDRPVTLSIAGSLAWRGYITPESYSADFRPAPGEVEFPLVGLLDTLQAVNIGDTGVGLQSIAAFVKECLDATGQSWSGVILPCQMLSVGGNDNVPELRLRLSRYNFLKENDADNMDDEGWTPFVGDTYYQVLEEICRYFGWTASMQGEVLVLSTPRLDITAFVRIAYSALAEIDTGSADVDADELERTEFDSLVYDGINHRKSISNGRKRITVVTDMNSGDNVVPQIDFGGSELHTYTARWAGSSPEHGGSPLNGRIKFLDPTYENVVLKAYRMNGDVPEEVEWHVPPFAEVGLPSACLVKATTWLDSEEIYNYSYRNLIRISADKNSLGQHFGYDVPMIILKSRGFGAFYQGCAISINASVFNSFCYWESRHVESKDQFGFTQWSSFNNNLRVSLRIGSKFWSGTEWVSQETIFNIPAGLKDDDGDWTGLNQRGQGAIINMKTLDMPWEGASGFIIPINETLSGQMSLTIYPWTRNTPDADGEDFNSLFIGNLDIRVYSPSPRRDAEGLRLTAPTGRNYQDELNVNLKMTSLKDDRIGHALLWYGGTGDDLTPIGKTVELVYPDAQTLYQPERWLLQTLLALYGGTQTKLELEVEYDSSLKMWDLCVVDDVEWIIIGMDIDVADEHMKLTLLRYE